MLQQVFTRALIAGAITFVAASSASAQLVNGKWQAPAKSGGSSGSAPRQGTQVKRENGDASAINATNSNGVVPVRVIPAVVMSDGSIMADFGAGLEIVQRACPSSVRDKPLRIIGGTATSPDPASSPAPDPTRSPTPNQTTASQRMLPSAQQRAASQAAAQASCHLRDQRGRAFATR